MTMRHLLDIHKRGIEQMLLFEHPHNFLEVGQTLFEKLNFPEKLEGMLIDSIPGKSVSHIGKEYVPSTVWSHPAYRTVFMTDSAEQ
jgi:hypothetical protein